jgi:cellulose synthase/poly-beta-1,6-N-acetylglucosamine synthase-like glycosyltransferase
MTGLQWLCQAAIAGILLRQLVILAAVARSARFLRQPPPPIPRQADDRAPVFFVVLPVLREAAVIADAVAHFEALAHRHAAQVIVVTTQRETAEAHDGKGGDGDTVTLVERLASTGKVIHLHYPDPDGLKGDQLNFAAEYCASTLLGDVPAERAFLLCYDADSRPPIDSLDHFERAVAASGGVSVFHQSSGFELRRRGSTHRQGAWARPSGWLGEGAALRANRFVLGFEIPRLVNRSAAVSRPKRWLCSNVYAHVTGHGLCVRLSLLLALPFPTRSPLEDMHYSFYLGSRNLPMVAVPSLDRAEVPATLRAQVDQAARWFFGPARFLRYLRDPATQPGTRAVLMAASACVAAAEWLGCAIVPAATALLLAAGTTPARSTAMAVVATYLAQLVVTDTALGAPASWPRRAIRVLCCPAATTLFGIGGFAGMVRLLKGGPGVGKTERR